MTKQIEIKNLNVSISTPILSDINAIINEGDFVGIVGPNGGGKTTLIKSILGLINLTSGQIKIFGKDLKEFNDYGQIGYLPQKNTHINQLFPISVEEVISLGLLGNKKFPKRLERSDKKKISDVIKLLNIGTLQKKTLNELSGGQQQKVFLARALVNQPKILIFDEPSTALDPKSREDFFKMIIKINQEKKTTILLVTHDTGYIGQYANKIMYLDRKLVFFGPIRDFCEGEDISSCFEKTDKHIIWHNH